MRPSAEIIAQPDGLRRRLIVALLVPLLLIVGSSSVFDYRLARQTADAAHDQALADDLFDLEAHMRRKGDTVAPDLSDEVEAMLRSNAPDRMFYAVRDADGRTLSGDPTIPDLPVGNGPALTFLDGSHRDANVRVALHRFSVEGQPLRITVMQTTEKRQASSRRIMTAMVLPNLAVFFATLLAVLWGVRRGLLPLQTVEREIGRRSVDDLEEIDLACAPLEIHPLLRRLNELFRLLREASAAQQRFIGDAAHQLRTPLAGLQTQLDLAAAEGDFSRNPERRARIEAATSRIGHLLNQLLVYARAETAASLTDTFVDVQLAELAEKSASIFLDAALAKNIDLGFEIAPARVRGLPWLLQEGLGNLIDNALRYTPAGGVVTVRCGRADEFAFLEVEDDGPGIAAEHLAAVRERFYRIPGSPGDGCGLGLAIVSEIAQRHGARFELLPGQGGGLRARIALPASEP